MRALAVHPDVLVVVSRVWQTTAAVVRAPAGPDDAAGAREAFLIDSPVYPDELELTAQVANQAGFAVAGLLATHGDWDHLLGRFAFPQAALGVAETTAARITGQPGDAVRKLRGFDTEHYVARDGTLGLGELQALPVPGKIELGSAAPGGERHELELHPAPGHTADGMAIWVPWARVLICGDYLSPVEIPTWSDNDGSRSAYRATLAGLEPLVQQADWVIPGHGGPIDGQRALAIWREDVAYVEDWKLPLARNDERQKQIHDANRAAGSS
ncbi:MBL fold metallo-hydrolase [Patulibacter defluvii]|uniref:MBL fold metallo-hydrolase n=1 Tax=Patulibacter defluvii TaxID=3095358 RepID=UPI002A75CEB6|nr:MBL fold metallo-hydrolase [Patulibacter sp. DM4]